MPKNGSNSALQHLGLERDLELVDAQFCISRHAEGLTGIAVESVLRRSLWGMSTLRRA